MQTRIDKWLWAVRIFKTRSDAAEACRTGKVTINGTEAKPSKEVKEGDLLTVKKVPIMRYSYKVVGLVERRLPAKDVPTYCLDITPQEELDKLNAKQKIAVYAYSLHTDPPANLPKLNKRIIVAICKGIFAYGEKFVVRTEGERT